MAHTLSKSDFKVARSCATKLYYKELGYPSRMDDDPFLALLADGGYIVEAIAKLLHPDGQTMAYGPDADTAHDGRTCRGQDHAVRGDASQ